MKKRAKAATSFFLSVGDDLNSLTSFQWLLVECIWTVLNMEEKKRGSQKQYQEELFDELLLFSAIAELGGMKLYVLWPLTMWFNLFVLSLLPAILPSLLRLLFFFFCYSHQFVQPQESPLSPSARPRECLEMCSAAAAAAEWPISGSADDPPIARPHFYTIFTLSLSWRYG